MKTILQLPSSFKIEVYIKHSRGLHINSTAPVFVRYRLRLDSSPGSTIRVDTRDSTTSSTGCDPRWDDRATLECQGSVDKVLPFLLECHSGVTFELHQRRRRLGTILGKLGKSSRLLGKGEVAWSEVLGSPGLTIERWIPVKSAGASCFEDGKPPALLVGIKIVVDGVSDVSLKQAMGRVKSMAGVVPEPCCCEQCKWITGEDDMLAEALTTAMVFDDF